MKFKYQTFIDNISNSQIFLIFIIILKYGRVGLGYNPTLKNRKFESVGRLTNKKKMSTLERVRILNFQKI